MYNTMDTTLVGDGESLASERKTENLTRKQKIIIFIIALGNFSTATAYISTAPFFPNEAKNKGVDLTKVGILFGCYQLACSFLGWFWGPKVPVLGTKFLLCIGLLIYGICIFIFGFLEWAPHGTTFFVLAIIIRLVESVGASAYVTGSLAEIGVMFPGREALTMALFEVGNGAGYAVGPVLGGYLFQIGGFALPLFITGSFILFVWIVTVFTLEPPGPKDYEKTEDDHLPIHGMLQLLKIPSISIICFTNISCVFISSMQIPTLSLHLAKFDISPTSVGLLFLLGTGTYALFAPVWGYLADKTNQPLTIMTCGAIGNSIAILLAGPSPILPLPNTLPVVAIGLGLAGFCSSAVYIPTFQTALLFALEHGLPENMETYGAVSGIMQSSLSFGAFLGPVFGAVAVQHVTYEWTMTFLSVGMMFLAFILHSLHTCKLLKRQIAD